MPNKILTWDVRSGSGNPTKSVPVNDIVNTVRKMECRKQGHPSCAKCDMKRYESHKTMRILEYKTGNYDMQGKVPMILKLQFHIIARTDDITNLETGDLRSHDKFSVLVLQTKVFWSTNVMEERSCPDQTLSGAADTDFCILLALACYLESHISKNRHGRCLFGECDENMESTKPTRGTATPCASSGPNLNLLHSWPQSKVLSVLTSTESSQPLGVLRTAALTPRWR
jgi:hypothetical protein